MVMIDGFIISHTMEEVEVHDPQKIDTFLPPYEPQFRLDVDDPRSFGNAALPDDYYRMRKAIQGTFTSSFEVFSDCHNLFENVFGTHYDLIEAYCCDDAETIFLVSGALTGTTRVAVDLMREKGIKVGLIKLRVFRPFPKDALQQIIGGNQDVIVLNRAVSYGAQGTLSQEVRSAFYNVDDKPDIYDVIISLGGKEVFPETLMEVCEGIKADPAFKDEMIWV